MDFPETGVDYAVFERYNREYEARHFVYSEANARVAASTRDMFLGWFLPKPLHGLGAPLLYALLDDRLLELHPAA